MTSSRQLAAIMFTDIVGYTALMGKDERKAFELLEKNRAIQKPVIEKFHGRFIKELGDGVMASFQTVSDAVFAALKIQELCNVENQFQLRVGIHLGEVVFENDDVFGDGVNIASRIQAVSIPGSIYISEAVHNNISNNTEIKTRFIRTEKLKNVKEPVKIYEVITSWSKKTIPGRGFKLAPRKLFYVLLGLLALLIAGYFSMQLFQAKHAPDTNPEKSIAILPFEDLSREKDQAYLGDGIAEEITHSITIIDGLKVMGTTSSSQFKGQKLAPAEIGKKLKVGIVLNGNIQKDGNRLRITANLINVKDNSTIWAQRFDKEMKDIFAIQDTIAKNIVEKLKLTLASSKQPRLIKKPTSDEVYNLYLKGLHIYKQERYDSSIRYFLQAIEKDSLYAPSFAYLALARTWTIFRNQSFSDIHGIREAKDYALRAIRIDPELAEGYSALGLMDWRIELDFASAKQNFEKSMRLNPGESRTKNRYGYFLLWMGEFNKAHLLATDAISSDPADYNGYVIAIIAMLYKKEFKDAKKYIDEGKSLFPEHNAFKNLQSEYLFASGQYDKFINSLSNNDSLGEDQLSLLSISYLKKGLLTESKITLDKLKNIQSKKRSNVNYAVARVFAQYQEKDSAFARLEKSFETREPEFKLIKIDELISPLKKDPRYDSLYRRYGFHRYQ